MTPVDVVKTLPPRCSSSEVRLHFDFAVYETMDLERRAKGLGTGAACILIFGIGDVTIRI